MPSVQSGPDGPRLLNGACKHEPPASGWTTPTRRADRLRLAPAPHEVWTEGLHPRRSYTAVTPSSFHGSTKNERSKSPPNSSCKSSPAFSLGITFTDAPRGHERSAPACGRPIPAARHQELSASRGRHSAGAQVIDRPRAAAASGAARAATAAAAVSGRADAPGRLALLRPRRHTALIGARRGRG
jgi:hypothetical protein